MSWLSRTTGVSYRLPTEAEWDRAAAGSQAGCSDVRTGNNGTCPVGFYGSNAAGLSGHGRNLWEWTEDCWEGDCGRRVLRGAAARHILKCGVRGVRIAHMALHLDETQPHGHILVVAADDLGRLGWNRVRKGFGMTGSESGRALMGALQERYHREVGSRFGLARGEAGSTAAHQPIDRVAGVKERLEEERRRGRADGEAAGREAAAASHRAELEEVQRQHQAQVGEVQKELAEAKKARRQAADITENVLHPLLNDLAGRKYWREALPAVFDDAGYQIEFDTAGHLWTYVAKPVPEPRARPAPVPTPRPASRDRSAGPAR